MWDDDVAEVVDECFFHVEVFWGGSCQARGGVDFDQPALAVGVDHHVEAVHLEAVFVVVDDALFIF